MRNIRILLVLFIILVLIIVFQKNFKSNSKISYPKSAVSSKPTSLPPTALPTPTLLPTSIPQSITPTPTPTSSLRTDMSSFVYPGSAVIESDSNSITLNSFSSSQAITTWYKDKITSMGLTAKSFVQTNTNGNVLNRLVGANGSFKISVDVLKQNSQTKTTIKVFLGSS